MWVHNEEKKPIKLKGVQQREKLITRYGYLAYVAYNKEGLNHVHACMCQYDLKENQGKF